MIASGWGWETWGLGGRSWMLCRDWRGGCGIYDTVYLAYFCWRVFVASLAGHYCYRRPASSLETCRALSLRVCLPHMPRPSHLSYNQNIIFYQFSCVFFAKIIHNFPTNIYIKQISSTFCTLWGGRSSQTLVLSNNYYLIH